MVQKCSRVAVIGAGPAGAIVTDALVKEQNFDTVRVFERKHVAGGTWVYSPSTTPKIPSLKALLEHNADLPTTIPSNFPSETEQSESLNSHDIRFSHTGIHENLHSNLPPKTMCFTQEPIPDIISDRSLAQYGSNSPFRHREVIREWVEQIFVRNDNIGLVEFHTTVESAQKKGDEWVLTLRKEIPGDKNYWWQEVFDALVVATGHFSLPYVPQIPGLVEFDQRFPGKIRHSKHFRSADEFKGKRIIVVGGSVSAFDALHEIRQVAQHPVISSLREPIPAFGWDAFTHPHIVIKPPISRFHNDGTIEFWDGTCVKSIDIVLFATGYDFSFPFLPELHGRTVDRRIKNLYQHVFDIKDPTLAFIGMVSGGLTFRVFEWQAVAVARLFAGRTKLPSQDVMHRWEDDRVTKRGNGVTFYDLSSEFEEYFEGLRSFAGPPVAGSQGRILPKYDPKWKDAFVSIIVKARLGWWEEERRRAIKQMQKTKKIVRQDVQASSDPTVRVRL